jgi:O-antigen/teichoic acid export membrane protein
MSKGFFRNILSETVIYGFTRYLGIFASVLLTPIYTRMLSKEDFGIMDVFNTWNIMVIAILPLGLYNAVLRFYPDVEKSIEEKKKTLGSIYTILLFTCGIYALGILSFKRWFFDTLIGKDGHDTVFYYSIAIVLLTVFHTYFLQLLRVKFEKYKYLTLTLTNFLLLTLLGFYFVYFQHEGIAGFFKAGLVGLLVSNVIGLLFLRKEFYFYYDHSKAKMMLSYSIHFITVFFLFQVSQVIDRYIINQYLDLSNVGLYSIAMRIGNFLQILIGSFGTAWMPYALSIKDKPDSKSVYKKMVDLYVIGLCGAITLLLLMRKEIIYFFAPDYMESYHTISWILFYNFITGLVYVFTLGIQITKKSKFLSLASAISIACNFVVSLLLVKPFGIEGVAAGSVVGAIVWIGIQHYFSQKYYPISFNYLSNGLILCALSIPLLLSYYLDYFVPALWIRLLIKIGFSLITAAAIWVYIKNSKSLQRIKSFKWN